MILKSFGCSFIFGSDLYDDGQNGPYAEGSRLTWPALLAKNFGYTYKTLAKPGAGNLQILERILTESVNNEPAVFVVGWSYIDRFDYLRFDDDPWPGLPWKTVLPNQHDNLAKFYYCNFHNQLKDKLSTLIYIKTAIDVLLQKNIKFIMTYMDPLMFETNWHYNTCIADLQAYIRPHMTSFDGKTFLELAQTNGCPISSANHPLEQAHQVAFELIKSYNLL